MRRDRKWRRCVFCYLSVVSYIHNRERNRGFTTFEKEYHLTQYRNKKRRDKKRFVSKVKIFFISKIIPAFLCTSQVGHYFWAQICCNNFTVLVNIYFSDTILTECCLGSLKIVPKLRNHFKNLGKLEYVSRSYFCRCLYMSSISYSGLAVVLG